MLSAGLKAGAERVVLTSSTAAAMPGASDYKNGEAQSEETIWTDLSAAQVNDYTQAKTLAEQDAWKFVETAGGAMTLTTVLPGSVQGPILSKDFSGSIELVERLLTGKVPAIPHIGFSTVDVRDLADLHLRAMTSPEAAGERFIGTSDFLWVTDVARLLRDHLGSRAAKVPTRTAPDFMVRAAALFEPDARFIAPSLGKKTEYSSAKAQARLGWHARSASEAVIAAAESLIQVGLV